VLAPIDALTDERGPAIRPGADGPGGRETAELRWLSPRRQREVVAGRNKRTHDRLILQTRRTDQTSAAEAPPEGAWRPHEAAEAPARADAANAAPGDHTRSRDGDVFVT